MSTHSTGEQAPSSCPRREAIDLNMHPPDMIPEEVFSVQALQQPQVTTQPVDVQALEDEVMLCTRSDFLEAKNNSRKYRGRTVVDADLYKYVDRDYRAAAITPDNHRADSLDETTIQFLKSIGAYASHQKAEKEIKAPEPPPPPPKKEPVFTCPICMDPFDEEVSTKCGHIFCKECIKAAIKAQGKCPTCRVKVTAKGLIRVFLPTATSPY